MSSPILPPSTQYDPAAYWTSVQKRQQQDQVDTLRQSLSFGATQSPDEYAKLLRQAAKTGVAPELAKEFQPEVKQAETVGAIDFDHFVATNPRTASWLSNPDHAAISHDDLQHLTAIERTAGEIRALTPWEGFKDRYVAPIHRTLMEYPLTRMGVDVVGGVSGMAGGIGSFLGWHGDNGKGNLLERVESKLSVNNTDLYINGRRDTENGLDWVAKNIAPMVPAMLTGAGETALLTRLGMSARAVKVLNGLTVGAMFTADQAGKTYTQMKESGASDTEARAAANRVFAINAPANAMFGASEFVPFMRKNPLASSLVLGGATGISGQVGQNVASGKWPDSYLDTVKQLLGSGVQGAAVMGGLHLGNEMFAERLGQIVLAAEQSKLKTRHVEKFGEAMQSLFDGNENLRIPAEQFATYFQAQNLDPVLIAEQVGVRNLNEVRLAGNDIEISPADFVAKLAPEHQKGLLADVVNPATGMTLRQEGEARDELEKFTSSGGMEKLQQLTAETDAETQGSSDYQQVKAELRQQYLAAGQTEAVAESYATLHANVYTNLARETKMTAPEVLKLYRPVIKMGAAPTVESGVMAQSVFHGSPYRFDKFTLEHIGKGEGAQAYGYGLYFAGSKQVAEYYHNALSEFVPMLDGKPLDIKPGTPEDMAAAWLTSSVDAQSGSPFQHSANALRSEMQYGNSLMRSKYEAAIAVLSKWEADGVTVGRGGQLYEASIPEDETFLAWDKPLSEQPEKVKAALAKAGIKFFDENGNVTSADNAAYGKTFDEHNISTSNQIRTGQDVYAAMYAEQNASQEAASKHLHSLGISGIKYLDGSSRSKGEGSHNYVLFDSSAIEITRTFYQSQQGDNAGKVVYRGEGGEFAGYMAAKYGKGLYVADSPEIAGKYGKVKALRLVGNPKLLAAESPEFAAIQQSVLAQTTPEMGKHATEFVEQKLREAVMAAGYDGVRGEGMDGTVIYEPEKFIASDSIPPPTTDLKQGDNTSPRGWFRVLPDGTYEIGQTKIGDLSTFVHEPAHSYLFLLSDLVKREGASEQLKSDYAKILDFLGAKPEAAKDTPWRMTEQEWDALSSDERDKFAGDSPPYPYHSNFHLVEVIDALRRGDPVPQRVIDSFGDNTAIQLELKSHPLNVAADEGGALTLTTEQHEKWARANEAYLREGKAPSQSLRAVFNRFAVWLTSIYKQASSLGVELTDDIRGVFDRMYAAEEGVNRVEQESAPKLFSTPEEAGWTPEQFTAYAESKGIEVEQAKSEILAKLNEAAVRERASEWKAEERTVREAQTVTIDQRPEYTAIRSLRKGQMDDGTELKLSREELVKQFGEARVKELQKQHPGIYRNEGGMDAEAAAEILGFNSGEELLRSIESAPRRSQAIEQATREYMTQKHGDIRYDGTLEDQARIALENDQKAARLHQEIRDLEKKLTAAKEAQQEQATGARAAQLLPPIASFRDAAQQMVEAKPLMDLQPQRYLDASRTAGREAYSALAKGDYEAAKAAKQKELINHFLFREATKAQAEADKTLAYVKRLSRASVREKLAQAGGEQGQHVYLDQIDGILESFRFVQESNKAIAGRRQTLAEFAADQQARALAEFHALNPEWATEHPGETPELPTQVDTTIAGLKRNYRELNIGELRAVRDALKNIETLARNEYSILRNGHRVSFAAEVADFEQTARANNASKAVPRSGSKLTGKERAFKSIHGLDAYMQKLEWFIDQLDGGNVDGPARRNVKRPIDDAWGEQQKLGDEIFGKLKKLIAARPKVDVDRLEESTGIQFPKSERPLTRKQLISWALNLGTEENQKVALLGEGLISPDGSVSPQYDAAINALTRSEWGFVQGVWDVLNGMLPAVREKALRTTGVDPKLKKVMALEVTPSDGNGEKITLRGGYYPLKSEPGDRVGMKQTDPANLAAIGYQKPKTSTSHLQQVTGATYRLQLDYENVLSRHLADVIKDTTTGEAISQVYKFISDPTVRETMRETLGEPEAREFLTWLQDFAGNNTSGHNENNVFLQWLMNRRSGMVVARLGGNLSSYLIQMGDVFKSLADPDIQTKYMVKAFLDIRRSPTKLIEEIRAKSPNEMRFREKNFNRDIRDMLTEKSVFDEKRQVLTEFLMDGFSVMDRLVTFPAWLARYRQGIETHGDEGRAVREADRTIARSYQAGDARNMSRMMRQGGLMRLLTTFQGDQNTWYGLISSSVRGGNLRAISIGIMALAAEQMVGQAIKNRGPKDDESWPGWLTEQALLAGVGKIPVFGDAAQYGLSKLRGQYASLQNPTMQALEKVFSAPGSLHAYWSGNKDAQQVLQDLSEATGIYLGIPGTSQAVRTWKYVHNVQTGKEQPTSTYEKVRGAVQGSNRSK